MVRSSANSANHDDQSGSSSVFVCDSLHCSRDSARATQAGSTELCDQDSLSQVSGDMWRRSGQ